LRARGLRVAARRLAAPRGAATRRSVLSGNCSSSGLPSAPRRCSHLREPALNSCRSGVCFFEHRVRSIDEPLSRFVTLPSAPAHRSGVDAALMEAGSPRERGNPRPCRGSVRSPLRFVGAECVRRDCRANPHRVWGLRLGQPNVDPNTLEVSRIGSQPHRCISCSVPDLRNQVLPLGGRDLALWARLAHPETAAGWLCLASGTAQEPRLCPAPHE
jgi:hypothetical protein